jgi:hypothetical protein
MRAYEVLSEGFSYIGNCTDKYTAPHLEEMMDKAKQITYRTFVKAVGLDNVREIFGDYSWGYQRGDVRMKNDPYVSYYRSTFDGQPCYYVRHSGIEYIFVGEQTEGELEKKTIPISANRFSILGDGAIVQGMSDSASVFHGSKTPNSLEIMTSRAPSAKAAKSLMRMIRQSKLEMIECDGDETSAKEIMSWLRKFI